MQRLRSLLVRGAGQREAVDHLLFQFARPHGIAGWRVIADKDWGGRSEATVVWHEDESADAQTQGAASSPSGSSNSSSSGSGSSSDDGGRGSANGGSGGSSMETLEARVPSLEPSAGFMRFAGSTSLQPGRNAARTGFCATKSPSWGPAEDVEAFPVLAMRVRTDGRRVYIVNVEPESFVPDDLYQGYLRTPANQWVTVKMPFRDMLLTSRGRARESQREFEAPRLLSLGFAVNDGQQGPFQIDVQWIAAEKGTQGPGRDKAPEDMSLLDI